MSLSGFPGLSLASGVSLPIPGNGGGTPAPTPRLIAFGDGLNNRVSIPTQTATGDFRLEFKFTITGNNDILFGTSANNSTFIYINTANLLRIRGSNSEGGTISPPAVGWPAFINDMIIERVGSTITVTRNGAVLGVTTNTATFEIDSMMSGAGSFFLNGGLWDVDFVSGFTTNPTYPLDDADDVALDTSGGGQNGTYINFSAGNKRLFITEENGNLLGQTNQILDTVFTNWFTFGGNFTDEGDGVGRYTTTASTQDKRANTTVPTVGNRRERHIIEVQHVNHDWVGFRVQINSVWRDCYFDINNQVIGGSTGFENVEIEELADNWLRLSAEVPNRTFNIYQLEAFGGDGVLNWISTGTEQYLARNPSVYEIYLAE